MVRVTETTNDIPKSELSVSHETALVFTSPVPRLSPLRHLNLLATTVFVKFKGQIKKQLAMRIYVHTR